MALPGQHGVVDDADSCALPQCLLHYLHTKLRSSSNTQLAQ